MTDDPIADIRKRLENRPRKALVHETCGGDVVENHCQGCGKVTGYDEVWIVDNHCHDDAIALLAEVDRLRTQRDGYRDAYEALRKGIASELDRLQHEYCTLPLRLLGPDETCPRCKLPAGEHRNYTGGGK